jgi:tryptophan synthase alpha chain
VNEIRSVERASRLSRRFEQVRASGRGALVTFITAGDPNPSASADLLQRLPAAGADIVEVGMPFSDPMADGPSIQAASQRALASGMTLARTLAMVSDFRANDSDTPLVLMGYFNPIYHYGPTRFVEDALSAGVDGLIIVDLPPEEDQELCHPALTAGLHWIRLVTPTTDEDRMNTVLKNTSGFVYYVSIAGITGTRAAATDTIESATKRIREKTSLPIAVGFGIRTRAQVGEIIQVADAAVVGSALVDRIADGIAEQHTDDVIVESVTNLVSDLAKGLAVG